MSCIFMSVIFSAFLRQQNESRLTVAYRVTTAEVTKPAKPVSNQLMR